MLGGSGQMADGQTIHKTVEGRQVELRCESRGGKPAAEVRNSFRNHTRIFFVYYVSPIRLCFVLAQKIMQSTSIFMCHNRFIHISSDYQASFRGKQRTGNA